jgi:hypothetical protein
VPDVWYLYHVVTPLTATAVQVLAVTEEAVSNGDVTSTVSHVASEYLTRSYWASLVTTPVAVLVTAAAQFPLVQ